ncbi:FkbM family methyltransferase [Gymnodinialimonas ceratoperidinii]|uniref:FkbM family methyltransferase n=1 Tax=Gymnodinialimonas ceratoperidinii TaxID=2856823 RepID=A0A8F6YE43_9RHOB|nr:FkbM family methyltransferase [Gymnodinialimonas ceratoperidinii]QXT41200.1 FkbM family methyltransferase [Gymnodinialimonas ceratoperidinii]
MTLIPTSVRLSVARKITRRMLKGPLSRSSDLYRKGKGFFPGGPDSITYIPENDLVLLKQNEIELFVARPSRLRYQLAGLQKRRRNLLDEYLVPEGLIRPNDYVIDIGANIGEFSLAMAAMGASVTSFEPDPTEFRALLANADGHPTIVPRNVALWNDDAKLTFFDANDTGDSSLFDPGRATQTLEVPARRLDTLAAEGIESSSVRLIKLEAEGAEPEIIDGAVHTLRRTDYVTVDMGPERGLSQANTVAEVVRKLTRIGFELTSFSTKRTVGLFENIRRTKELG